MRVLTCALRDAMWRLRWLFVLAVAMILLQAFGWTRVGRIVAVTWRGVWPIVYALWPLVAAVAATVLVAAWPVIRTVGSRSAAVVGARRWLRAALAGLGILAALLVVVVVLPPRFVAQRSFADAADQARAKTENDVRTTLLQGLGGAVLLLGAWFTWRQLQTAREGQITERFTRALDQLGKAEQPDVTIGGIYSLERIARDSARDQAPIAEILTAYVREHARWPPRRGLPSEATPVDQLLRLRERQPAIQAAITVLACMPRPTGEDNRLDLRRTDLRRVDLRGGRFAWARLEEAHLELAWMRDVQLQQAYLGSAHLQSAQLQSARLEGAHLKDAHLERVKLDGAHLQGANLQGAHLQGAILTGATLTGASFQQAVANAMTRWPDGFDWREAGVNCLADEVHAGHAARSGQRIWQAALALARRIQRVPLSARRTSTPAAGSLRR